MNSLLIFIIYDSIAPEDCLDLDPVPQVQALNIDFLELPIKITLSHLLTEKGQLGSDAIVSLVYFSRDS